MKLYTQPTQTVLLNKINCALVMHPVGLNKQLLLITFHQPLVIAICFPQETMEVNKQVDAWDGLVQSGYDNNRWMYKALMYFMYGTFPLIISPTYFAWHYMQLVYQGTGSKVISRQSSEPIRHNE